MMSVVDCIGKSNTITRRRGINCIETTSSISVFVTFSPVDCKEVSHSILHHTNLHIRRVGR